MKKKYNKYILWAIFTAIILSLVQGVSALDEKRDSNNGVWNEAKVILENTGEAQLMVRTGDIDNFGFPFKNKSNQSMDPFSGEETRTHGYPFMPEGDDPQGTDRVMVVSGYNYNGTRDGYASRTSRSGKNGYPSNRVQKVTLEYEDYMDGLIVDNAYIQMFIDDYQPKNDNYKAGFKGNNVYTVVMSATIDGELVSEQLPEVERTINNVNQHGPIGKMITFAIPDRCLYMVESGSFSLEIDDKRSNATGDGHAIDFVKMLVNLRKFSHTATVSGVVKEKGANPEKPLAGVQVVAAGKTVTTNELGQYTISDIAPGQVIISASKSGYEGQDITLPYVQAGSFNNADFYLEKEERPGTPIINHSPTEATYGDVRVEIFYPEEPTPSVTKVYKIDDGVWKTYNDPFYLSENCTIKAKGISQRGNESLEARLTLTNLLTTKVEVDVYDADGHREKFSTDDETKREDDIKSDHIKLKGKSEAYVGLAGRRADYFKYKFVQAEESPNDLPEEGWSILNLTEDRNEEDVLKSKNGFLNHRAYDVSHLPLKSDESAWSKRDEVYKSPFEATEYKSADVAQSVAQYGNLVQYSNAPGVEKTRWSTNTVFMSQMDIENAVGSEYKESSKFWGYISVPETGIYKFGISSDDGSTGSIIINNTRKIFADMFKPQSTQSHSVGEYELEEGKYYPVFLEYFNWGGEASFHLNYKYKVGNSYSYIGGFTQVPSQWLYPSKDLSPGEYPEAVFRGNNGIAFPKVSGDYYLAYRTGEGEKISKEGFFGPFTVNGNSEITVERMILSGNTVEEKQKLNLRYKIIPEDIKPRSNFQLGDGYKKSIEINDVKIQDKFNEKIKLIVKEDSDGIVVNGNEITIELPNIVYNLVEGEKMYRAGALSYEIQFFVNEEGGIQLSEDDKSLITFTDVNKAKRQMHFENISIDVIETGEVVTEIEREIEEVPASEEYSINYSILGEETYCIVDEDSEYYDGENDEIRFEKFYYEEVFPKRMEVVDYPEGLHKSGTYEMGYTLKGEIKAARMYRVDSSDRYRVGGDFTIKVMGQYPGDYNFVQGSCEFKLPDGREGKALSNDGTLAVLGKRIPNLRVLEIQPFVEGIGTERRGQLIPEMFTKLVAHDGEINIDVKSIDQFNGGIQEINGFYDVVFIGNNHGGYTAVGDAAQSFPNGSKNNQVEYETERDITNRNAQLVKEFIEAGQLTIFQQGAISGIETKMYKNFNEYMEYSNVFVVENVQSMILDIPRMFDLSNKRPLLNVIKTPSEYNGGSDSFESGNHLEFVYDIENLNISQMNENYMSVELFIDKNGDGFFRDNERVHKGNAKMNGKGYSLSYSLRENFTGLMPWKLRVKDTVNGASNYKTGYTAFKGEKTEVRVLHLIPNKGTNYSLINNNSFMSDNLKTELYDISVTEMSIGDFESEFDGEGKMNLNGVYDMVILGFYDVYNGSDLREAEAVGALKEFIATGQSVMFTHDTFMFHLNNPSSACYSLTKEFRDIAGQSRYKDPNNELELDLFGGKITHDEVPLQNANKTKFSYGFTKEALYRAKTGNFSRHNKTFKVNESVITKYPFVLGDELTVAQTHYQYFQLNLEDPDVVVWYNYEPEENGGSEYQRNKHIKYDSRNNYYTYSKGNITYSGTGHSSPNRGIQNEKDMEEQKLFINTILKAARNANHAPTVEVANLQEGKIYPKGIDEIQFSFIPDDVDGDEITGKVFIDDKEVKDYKSGELGLAKVKTVEISRGVLLECIGEKEVFSISLKIKDEKGAVAMKSFNVHYKDVPYLNLSSTSNNGYLKGDRGNIELKMKAIRAKADISTNATGIEYSVEHDESIEIISKEEWDIPDVEFTPEPSYGEISRNIDFNVLDQGTTYIRSGLDYTLDGFQGNREESYEHAIHVKTGEMKIKIQNNDGSNFGRAKMRITYPDEEVSMEYTDDYGQLNISGIASGEYNVTVMDLPEGYSVSGAEESTVDISYDNSREEIVFNVINKSESGNPVVDFRVECNSEYLVGDRVPIKLIMDVYNENPEINTDITGIKHIRDRNDENLVYEDEEFIWNVENVSIDGGIVDIPTQEETYNISFKRAGNFKLLNSVEYTYFGTSKQMVGTENYFNVKSGKIEVQVENVDRKLTKGLDVIIRDKVTGDIVSRGTTDDESGIFTEVDLPTGLYEVSVPDIYEFNNGGEYKKDVRVNYRNNEAAVKFKIHKDSKIIKSGMFVNEKFLRSNESAAGFRVPVATDFKVLKKNSELYFTIGSKAESISLKLFKYNEYGQLEQIESDMYIIVNGIRSKIKDGVGEVLLEGVSGDEVMEVILPKSENCYNHYVLVHVIHQNADVGDTIDYRIKVNGVEEIDKEILVVDLPFLE